MARRQPQLNMAVVFLSFGCFVTAGTLKPLCVTFGLCISYADVERRTWLVFVASQQPQLNMVLASLSFELLASSSLSLSLFSVFRMDALARSMLSRHSSMRCISTATTPPPSFEIEPTFFLSLNSVQVYVPPRHSNYRLCSTEPFGYRFRGRW